MTPWQLRASAAAAVGGGALTDAAGLLAALYLRGVEWIAVPTTLAAQVDASLGGKTGVDLPEGKNLVGAFHNPAAVVIDPAVLATLPPAIHIIAPTLKTGTTPTRSMASCRWSALLWTSGMATESREFMGKR